MPNVSVSRDELVEGFRYLDELRDSGITNMWGASSYLERDYGLDRPTARFVHAQWMKTFEPGTTLEERADKVKLD